MQRSPGGGLRLALTVFITFLNWQPVFLLECAEHEYQTEEGQCAPCAQCHPGKEADTICGFGKGRGMTCKTCAAGTFSATSGAGPCLPHTQCETQKRVLARPGTATMDSQCGDCVLGYYTPAGEAVGITRCLPCSSAPPDMALCAANNATYGVEDANEDTIGVLVRLIAEKQENALALEELLKDFQSKQIVTTNISSSTKKPSKLPFTPQIPHICQHQHHLHTVQGMASRTGSCCTRCNQKKWPEVLLSPETAAAMAAMPVKPPKAAAKARRPGETTILSVGRFRVARIPEQRPSQSPTQNITEVKTISESSSHETTDATPSHPAEQKTLLGNGIKTKWLKPADSKQEDVA